MIELVYETLFDVYNERIAYRLTWKEFSFCFVFNVVVLKGKWNSFEKCVAEQILCQMSIFFIVLFIWVRLYVREGLFYKSKVTCSCENVRWNGKWIQACSTFLILFDISEVFLFQTALNFVVFLITYKKQREWNIYES